MIEANTLPRVPARRASGGLTRKLMRQPVGLIAAAVLLLLYAAAFLASTPSAPTNLAATCWPGCSPVGGLPC